MNKKVLEYKKFKVDYELENGTGDIRTYDFETDKFKTYPYTYLRQKDVKLYYIHDGKNFKDTDEDLKSYANVFNCHASSQLATNPILQIRYTTNYHRHKTAILATFKRLSKSERDDYLDYTDVKNYVSVNEYKYIILNRLSGFIYLNPLYKCVKRDYYGYDFSFNYPSLLGSSKLRFPRTSGTEVKYDTLPKK
jgi:hypothetical protein